MNGKPLQEHPTKETREIVPNDSRSVRRQKRKSSKRPPTMKSPCCRWNTLLFWAAQLLQWSHLVVVVNGQPTPPPTLFDGYDYSQCAVDVFASDRNEDGFISRNELEYLALINRVGASVCFRQTTPLTATQQSAYFRLVCDIVPDCRFTSELPTTGLTVDQIIKICIETKASIFSTCPEPTASPGPPAVSPPMPATTRAPTPPTTTPVPPTTPSTPVPPSPSPPAQTPGGTPPPTLPFDPVAPDVSLAQCRQDLNAADADGNERITRAEFVTFLETFGARVCYEREGTELSETEAAVFDALVCLATEECEGVTEIATSLPSFTPSIAFTLCTVTYGAMNTVCEGKETPTDTATPTKSPTTTQRAPDPAGPTPSGLPPRQTPAPVGPPGAAATINVGYYETLLVTGVATMLSYLWM